jgi:hypothetical protein
MGRRRQLDRDLDAEISAHIDEAIEELVRQGLPSIEARRAALSRFGGITQTREAHREVRSFLWMSDLLRDCRYAVRSFRRAPGFSTVAILTLALGIGATTAIFSVVYGVLLKPLPFRDADQLVALYHVTPASRTDAQGAATYFTYRDHARVFEDIGLWNLGNVSVTRDGTPEQVQVLRVTDGTLSLLGVRAEVGRLVGKLARHLVVAPGEPVASTLYRGDELREVDLERVEDLGQDEVHAHRRLVAALVKAGLVREVNLDRTAMRYCPNMGEHCHFYCDECGGVYDIDMPADGGVSSINVPKGYRVNRFELAIHGACPKCARRTSSKQI